MIRKGVIRCGLQAWKWTAKLRVRPMDLTEIMVSNKSFVKLASTFKFDSKSLNYIYNKTGSSCGYLNGFFHWNCQWRPAWGEWFSIPFQRLQWVEKSHISPTSIGKHRCCWKGQVFWVQKDVSYSRTMRLIQIGLNVGLVWVAELKGELALYASCN